MIWRKSYRGQVGEFEEKASYSQIRMLDIRV